jgi:hypothetical protein
MRFRILPLVDHRFTSSFPPQRWLHTHATISKMAKNRAPKSRRRSKSPLSGKIFVYFTDEERKLVDSAADAERRSISSFVANAAISAAEAVQSKQGKKR